jgi:hypothetical protein
MFANVPTAAQVAEQFAAALRTDTRAAPACISRASRESAAPRLTALPATSLEVVTA